MADVALKPTPAVSVFTDECLRTIIVAIIAYWALLAAALPVTNFDSHVYNLRRLAVAENEGFWQTSQWNSIDQIVFPWTFDAVHYCIYFNDANFHFLKGGMDWTSDFGLIGFAALLTGSVYIWRPTLRNPCWTVVASGFAALGLMSFIALYCLGLPWRSLFLAN